jgi:hypothetical protein
MKKFNFGASFTYMFKDSNWVTKYLIGILIAIVPILNLAWAGYGVGIIRNMAQGKENPLPEWDSIGDKFKDGLFVSIASFVYNLPLILVACLAFTPVLLIPPKDSDAAATMVLVTSSLVGCCVLVYVLLYSFLLPSMLVHYARNNTFGSLFQIKQIFALVSHNIGQYLMAWLASLVAVLIFAFISPFLMALCFVPIYFGIAWLMSVVHYAYGQVGLLVQDETGSV